MRIIKMKRDKLTKFVHEYAQPGDIAISDDHCGIYCCTEYNIGKNINNPKWFAYRYEDFIQKYFVKNMTLEEKVDFLIKSIL